MQAININKNGFDIFSWGVTLGANEGLMVPVAMRAFTVGVWAVAGSV